ncbi:transcriptional regulator MelR [Conservatibacter flavescens]|uniref:Transcriptional regulator MelR n=1 Tax=Conservatibacter flavescens TaxID=28161 RepID=A0A2M8S612_9PAST|nr:transcriptional regulator MelR [Conservatibacter flavescens]PJG86558.1 transcriptional regulator MelR [Conservatibacter flavescens]
MEKKSEHSLQFKINDENKYGSEAISPLSLCLAHYPLNVVLQHPPGVMSGYHWHGHMEINIPFDDDVEYLFNGKPVIIKANHIALFWASVPHRLVNLNGCTKMAVIDVPVHQFLAWTLPQKLINHITHGVVVESQHPNLVSLFEIQRWERELALSDVNRQQLVHDEIQLMVKRIAFDGWTLRLEQGYDIGNNLPHSSKYSQHYVSLMLDYIANHYNDALTVSDVATAVGLNTNYAMGLFQSVMQLTIKQYILMMRINHAKALLSDTDKTMLDISLTVGFNAISRFYDNFQKYTGVSPLNYRKLSRANSQWQAQGLNPLTQTIKGASDGKSLLLPDASL